MARTKLPLHVEKALADVRSAQAAISTRYEGDLRSLTSQAKQSIMCAAGCSHCCHYPATMSVLEGILLQRYLTHRGAWVPSLKQKLQAHADKTFGLAYEIWLLSDLPCPLLNEQQRCSVYSARPFTCRVTYSTGDPYLCHPHRLSSNVSIVPRVKVLAEFHSIEERLFSLNGARHILMPISKALLLAEKLVSGEYSFDRLDHRMAAELEEQL